MKILKIWGIPVYKILSDDEFVEKTQKVLRVSKILVWIYTPLLILLCVSIPGLIALLWSIFEDEPDVVIKWAGAGLIVGICLGIFVGNIASLTLQTIMMALDVYDFNRGSKLLIKYHGILKETGMIHEKNDELERI